MRFCPFMDFIGIDELDRKLGMKERIESKSGREQSRKEDSCARLNCAIWFLQVYVCKITAEVMSKDFLQRTKLETCRSCSHLKLCFTSSDSEVIRTHHFPHILHAVSLSSVHAGVPLCIADSRGKPGPTLSNSTPTPTVARSEREKFPPTSS